MNNNILEINRTKVNIAIKLAGIYSPVLAGLIVAITSVSAIHTQLVALSYNNVVAWLVAVVAAIVIEVLGVLFVTLKSEVTEYESTRNKSDIALSTTWLNPLLYGYLATIATLFLTTKIFHLVAWSLLVFLMMGPLTYIYHAESDKLERAKNKRNNAKDERSKLAEYRTQVQELSTQLEGMSTQHDAQIASMRDEIAQLTAQNEKLRTDLAHAKDALRTAQTPNEQQNAQQNAQPSAQTSAQDTLTTANDVRKSTAHNRRMSVLDALRPLHGAQSDALNKSDLAQQFACSADTIRRDLQWLENNEFVSINGTIKVHAELGIAE